MMFRVLFLPFLLLAGLVFSCIYPLPALAAQPQTAPLPFSADMADNSLPFLNPSSPPALRLLYTANTRGALFPCPT